MAEANGVKVDLVILSFDGQVIERSNDKTLEDCDLYNQARVMGLFRVQ